MSPASSSWRAPSQCKDDGARLDERRLAAARLVHRRVARSAGHRARRERVARELGALARQRRREDLVAVAAAAAGRALAALAARTTLTAPPSSSRSSCERRRSRPGRDPPGHLQRRARLPALDLARASARSRRSARRDRAATCSIASRSALTRAPRAVVDVARISVDCTRGRHTNVRYRIHPIGATAAATDAGAPAGAVASLPSHAFAPRCPRPRRRRRPRRGLDDGRPRRDRGRHRL